MSNQVFFQSGVASLLVDRLSDGSTAIVDSRSKSVHSLNPSATLVWDACAQGATLEQICAFVETKTGMPVDSEVIRQALPQLERLNLIAAGFQNGAPLASVNVNIEGVDLGRRSLLKRAGVAGFAIPVILTLTASEQKAYAFQTLSGTTTSTTPQPPQ